MVWKVFLLEAELLLQPQKKHVFADLCKDLRETPSSFFFFFFFLGYRIVVYSFQAKEPSGHQTNLRYAGTTAKCACNRRSVHRKKSP